MKLNDIENDRLENGNDYLSSPEFKKDAVYWNKLISNIEKYVKF